MIRTRKLTKKYGQHLALAELDLDVAPGEILGFLGPNGAGKSTTLRILSGYLPPTSGSCSISGKDLAVASLEARRCTGYLPENFVAPHEMRVQEYLQFRARLKGLSKAKARSSMQTIVGRLGLEPRLRQPFSDLSKGFRQRVGLADALLADPPALLLDEPFSGLDPLQRQEFRDILRGLAGDGKAILFSSHVLPEVEEIATRVQILHRGQSQAVGTLEELQELLQREASLLLRLEQGDAQTVVSLEKGAERFRYRLEVRSPERYLLHLEDPKVRPALFRWVAEQGLPMVEFREQRPDLEQLFRALVEAGNRREAAQA